MLPSVTFAHVAGLCGKRNFKGRRRYAPYTFFYHAEVPVRLKLCARRRQIVPDDDII